MPHFFQFSLPLTQQPFVIDILHVSSLKSAFQSMSPHKQIILCSVGLILTVYIGLQ